MNRHKYVYFDLSEFACKCGECDSDGSEMDHLFVANLDAIRESVGFPLVVTSGYRCPKYNARISTTGENGPHTTGKAADFGVSGAQALLLLTHATDAVDITGIGINQKGDYSKRFIHLDALKPHEHQPRPHVWTY